MKSMIEDFLIGASKMSWKLQGKKYNWILIETRQSILYRIMLIRMHFRQMEISSSDPKCGVLASSESVASLIEVERLSANVILLRLLN